MLVRHEPGVDVALLTSRTGDAMVPAYGFSFPGQQADCSRYTSNQKVVSAA